MAQRVEFRFHITGPEFSKDYVVAQGTSLIGREPSCQLQLAFPLVSRRHAQLDCTETGCTITDLESANGTTVNDVRLTPNVPVELSDQALITIGPFEIRCEAVPQGEAAGVEEPALPPAPAEAEAAEPAPAEKAPVKRETPAKKAARAPREKAPPAEGAGEKGPPPPAPPAEAVEPVPLPAGPDFNLPGLSDHSIRLLNFLPGIFHTDFMSRFLALFEAILLPIEWNVDNFDLYLDPGTAPIAFLPWLANWYEIVFDSTWTEMQRRTLLKEAHRIYSSRGTRWALTRALEIYTGQKPEIVEFADPKDPFTFTIRLPIRARDADQDLIEKLVDSSKPAHTSYALEFKG